jgi:hypothetical protein
VLRVRTVGELEVASLTLGSEYDDKSCTPVGFQLMPLITVYVSVGICLFVRFFISFEEILGSDKGSSHLLTEFGPNWITVGCGSVQTLIHLNCKAP